MKNRLVLLTAAVMLSALACSPKVVLVKVQETGEVKPGVQAPRRAFKQNLLSDKFGRKYV